MAVTQSRHGRYQRAGGRVDFNTRAATRRTEAIIEYHRPGSDEIIRPARVVRAQFTPENPAR
jgi:hypothetical protein